MKLTRTMAALAITATVGLAAAGCSSSSAGTGDEAADDNPYNLITPGVILTSTSGSQPPFTVQGNGDDLSGYLIDITEKVADELGLKVEYKFTTSAAGIQGLTSGQYDLVADGLGITAERENAISFSKGLYWSQTAALTKKDSPISSIDDLAGKHVAALTGSVQAGYLKKIEGAVPVEFESQDAEVSALTSGTVDAVFIGGPDASHYVEKFPNDVKIAATQPVDHATAVAFQKDNDALVEAFDAEVQKMADDGTLLDLYHEYFPDEEPADELVDIWPSLKG